MSNVKAFLILFLGFGTLIIFMSPTVDAVSCSLNIDSIDFPAQAKAGTTITVTTAVTVTCNMSKSYIEGRVDLVNPQSGSIISISPLEFGYFPYPGGTATASTSNLAQTPSDPGYWNLLIHITIFTGRWQGLLAYTTRSIRIDVTQ